MVFKIGDNIISPIGETTEQNFQAVLAHKSALQQHDGRWGIPESFFASLFTEEQTKRFAVDGLTRFESLVVSSVKSALDGLDIDLSSPKVVFILSTAKGNIEELGTDAESALLALPGSAAQHIATYLHISTLPIVVCNACISGVSALTLAKRLLDMQEYDYAIVCGADCQSKFIVSGFQSLKSLSPEACRPFDEERLGLNLGEAAATMVLSRIAPIDDACAWTIVRASVANDANHLTNPSKTGEGCHLAIQKTLSGCHDEELSFVNAHGTATMYNDQMESVAIDRSGLHSVPVNALKGYFGHTMGAAGVLETILCMRALDEGWVLATKGFSEIGVSGKISVCREHAKTAKTSFLKLMSGFGGCNGALLIRRGNRMAAESVCPSHARTHRVHIYNNRVEVDGQAIDTSLTGKDMLTEVYKTHIGDYPKFFKMDKLCKLGFVATELLLQAEGKDRFDESKDRAVILFNRHSSVTADMEYLSTISDKENYYPSPSAFIYTLPNIVTGEIAIRNKYHGETAFFVLSEKDELMMERVVGSCFMDAETNSIVTGWLDYDCEDNFEADLCIVSRI